MDTPSSSFVSQSLPFEFAFLTESLALESFPFEVAFLRESLPFEIDFLTESIALESLALEVDFLTELLALEVACLTLSLAVATPSAAALAGAAAPSVTAVLKIRMRSVFIVELWPARTAGMQRPYPETPRRLSDVCGS